MVKVFPAPVWPYAITVPLYPSRKLSTMSRAQRANVSSWVDFTSTSLTANTHESWTFLATWGARLACAADSVTVCEQQRRDSGEQSPHAAHPGEARQPTFFSSSTRSISVSNKSLGRTRTATDTVAARPASFLVAPPPAAAVAVAIV